MPLWILACAAALALMLVVRYVATSGTWLDEYWQYFISGSPSGSLVPRLVADTHPPWFNLLGRTIIGLTGRSVVASRLVDLLLVASVLGGGLCVLRGLAADVRWRIFLLLVASGGAVGLAALAASFRVYPWLLALAGLQAAILLAIVLRRSAPAALAGIVTAASVGLHYGHAAGAIAIALVTIALCWREGDRRVGWAVASGLTVAVIADFGFALVQSPHWQANANVSWIADNPGGAWSAFAAVLVDYAIFNLLALLLLVLAIMRGSARPIAWLLAPLPLAFAAWLVLDAAKPIIVPRYLPSVTAILAVAAAFGWHELRLRRGVDVLAAAVIALQPLIFAWARPPLPGWEVGARMAAAITRQCPEAQLYAVPASRFRDNPDSPLAHFELPVFGLGYASVGREFGLQPQYVTAPALIRESRCPAILWMEAAHGVEHASPEAVLRRAQLQAPAGVSARFVPTPNGALLLISSADRLQRRP
jgi:hypothetical protein